MRIRMRGGLGDEVALTADVREWMLQHPDEMLEVEIQRKDVLKGYALGVGKRSNGCTVDLGIHQHEALGNIPHSFAKQIEDAVRRQTRNPSFTFRLVDDTPELRLDQDEIIWAGKALEPFYRLSSDSHEMERSCAIDVRAMWESRRWPLVNYQVLTSILRRRGWLVFEVGAGDDQGLLGATESFAGKTTWRNTAALIARCALYVGNDSGLMHVAAAVGTPQVIPYGVKPWYSRAYWNTVPVYTSEACPKACDVYSAACMRQADPRQHGPGLVRHCLSSISPAEVLAAVALAEKRFLP